VFSGRHDEAAAAFKAALERAGSIDDPRAVMWASDSASAGLGPGRGLDFADRAVELTRARALLGLLPMALERQAQELLWNSRFELAYVAAQEGYRLAVEIGHGVGPHLANMATVEAVWGRDEDARRHATDAAAIGRRRGSSVLTDGAEMTLAFIDLTAGRAAQATERLLALTDLGRPAAHVVVALNAIPDLIEAAVRSDRQGELSDEVARYRAWVKDSASETGAALLARCEALLGERAGDDGFGEAIDRAPALPPFQQARTRLMYGEWLRRERRRQDARVHLRVALELFAGLRAESLRTRAEAELRATGETARKRDPSTLDQLTPQELQIAGLVAEGMTNREIAERLYLSPRTIDYHLR
jgi:ATP/maltotriose-dependent transcriptional regulator MalT